MHARCGPRACCPAETVEQDGPITDPDPPEGIAEREWRVLQELATAEDARVGFQGIKRRLELHPEALRRVLRRLRHDGLVTKGDIGYRLTPTGDALVSAHAAPRPAPRPMPVAHLITPSHVTPDRVVKALARRWFDGLHWYGVAEGSGEHTLTWLTDPDDQPVRVRVGLSGIRIEAALGDADPDERLRAAAPLLAAVADLLRAPPAQEHPAADPRQFAA